MPEEEGSPLKQRRARCECSQLHHAYTLWILSRPSGTQLASNLFRAARVQSLMTGTACCASSNCQPLVLCMLVGAVAYPVVAGPEF